MGASVPCPRVTSRGKLSTEWQRLEVLCERPEWVLALPKADVLGRTENLRAETDRISQGIRSEIELREREQPRCLDLIDHRGGRFSEEGASSRGGGRSLEILVDAAIADLPALLGGPYETAQPALV